MEKILVIGANGQVGRCLLKHLAECKKHVVAMIRSESQTSKIRELGGIPLVMDIESDFSEALRDIDCVVFTAGSGSATGQDKTISIDQEGAIRAINFALMHKIKLFVMVSAQGARSLQEASPIQHYYMAKSKADKYLISCGLNYTIYRPGRLSNEVGLGKIRISNHFEFKGTTRRDDLAKTICIGIDLPKTKNRIIEIFDGEIDIKSALKSL